MTCMSCHRNNPIVVWDSLQKLRKERAIEVMMFEDVTPDDRCWVLNTNISSSIVLTPDILNEIECSW